MIEKFADYKKYFEIDYKKVVQDTLNEPDIKKAIIDYNQKEQLQEGIDSEGKRIVTLSAEEQGSNSYSRFTKQARSKKGLQITNVDLKDTGQFYNSFEVKVTEEQTEVLADFTKGADDIRNNFDSSYSFLGLTNNSLENFTWSFFYESFSSRLKRLFGI